MPFSKSPTRLLTNFAPTQLTGLKVWLDASDPSTLSLSGSKVTAWRDKSGNLNHAAQGTDANRPTWVNEAGRQFVKFTAASSQYMTITHVAGLNIATTATIVVALRINTTGNQAGVLVKGSSTVAFNYGLGNGVANHIESWDNGATLASVTTTSTGVFHVAATIQTAGASTNFRSDSVADTVAGVAGLTVNTEPLWVGCKGNAAATPGNYTNSDLLEVMLYSGALSTASLYEIERYLSAKHLIPVG